MDSVLSTLETLITSLPDTDQSHTQVTQLAEAIVERLMPVNRSLTRSLIHSLVDAQQAYIDRITYEVNTDV